MIALDVAFLAKAIVGRPDVEVIRGRWQKDKSMAPVGGSSPVLPHFSMGPR